VHDTIETHGTAHPIHPDNSNKPKINQKWLIDNIPFQVDSDRHWARVFMSRLDFFSIYTYKGDKMMVPMVFVYFPAMLIVIEDYFTWSAFLSTTLSCAVGIFMVATWVAEFFLVWMPVIIRWAMAFCGVLLVAPGQQSDLFALVFVAPVLFQQVAAWRKAKPVVSQNV
jgi:uncharacterized membrane protein